MIVPMSTVSVLVPWSGNCPHRLAAWQYVRSWYRINFPDWDIVRGHGGDGPWCKARAVADALAQTDGEILIVADADCVAPEVGLAVQAVASGAPWAMPHHMVHRLSEKATAAVLSGTHPEAITRQRENYAQMPYAGYPGGGVTVISREVYADTPLDPRFTGWGQEDQSWALALNCLHGTPWRKWRAPLWHLWHPPQQRLSRSTGSQASRELHARYQRLRSSPEAMREHLKPARQTAAQAAPG